LLAYLAKTQRPYQKNTALNTNKLEAVLDFPLLSVEEAIKKISL